MPFYPRSRNTERGYRNARTRANPYTYRKPIIPAPALNAPTATFPAAINIPPLMSSNLTPIVLTKETKDAGTQTITRDKNLDPINFARLYINTQISGQTIEEKRAKFYEDRTLNQNIRKSYRKFMADHNNNDDKSKLTKVERKYHLVDRSLNTKILQMTPNQIKIEYPGIGWDYLGLQARMEFQRINCSELTECETDERFFQDKSILTNLKIGYSRWKSENITSGNSTILYINKSAQSPQELYQQSEDEDALAVSELLPDPTLNTDILSMTLEEITATYGSIDFDLLGLQARMEYAKSIYGESQLAENIHNIDIDFMLDEKIPQIVRSWYRKWLLNNQFIKRQDELFVVKVSNKVDNTSNANSPKVAENTDSPSPTLF